MTFEEFIETKYDYDTVVWVCDYRFNDYSQSRPIRHVPPTQVEVHSNQDLPKNKKVYYSSIHFKPVGKKQPIIAPYDNTGFRSFSGVSLQVFLTEEEAKEYYKKTCNELIEAIQKHKSKIEVEFNNRIIGIKEEMEKYS